MDIKEKLPLHIGIIMDGNGRWAKSRNKPRTFGHDEGLRAAKRIVRAASEIGIKFLTLYVFSTENWKRTEKEVSFLMNLVKQHLRKEFDFYRERQIRVVSSGDIDRLPVSVYKELKGVEKDTAHFAGLTVNLAVNYGGRDEVVRAVAKWLKGSGAGQDQTGHAMYPETGFTEADLAKNLDHPEIPYIDLVIRTGGEMRLSNFFIWQSAYAEFYFDAKLWPDWEKADLEKAISDFAQRERRFGNAK